MVVWIEMATDSRSVTSAVLRHPCGGEIPLRWTAGSRSGGVFPVCHSTLVEHGASELEECLPGAEGLYLHESLPPYPDANRHCRGGGDFDRHSGDVLHGLSRVGAHSAGASEQLRQR